MKHKLVKITWLDSKQPIASWFFTNDSDSAAPAVCVSVGWVVYETKEAVLLCQSLADQGSDAEQANGALTIPKCCIIKKRILK